MNCLVIIEKENGFPTRPSLATITAAKELSNDIHVLVLDSEGLADIKKISGVKKIFTLENNADNMIAENLVKSLIEITSDLNKIFALFFEINSLIFLQIAE